ncbi:MAG: HopJ type III effector protein [Gallionellaceae bacterium]
MELKAFLKKLNTTPEQIAFTDTIAVIDAHYDFTPTAFKNGAINNDQGQNNGSCKLFAFAKLHNLNEQQTLHCFGTYYRDDVLKHPEGTVHQNIRNFIKHGWNGVQYSGLALNLK